MLKKRMKEMEYQSVDAQQQNGGNMENVEKIALMEKERKRH